MHIKYEVLEVAEDRLPADHDWILIAEPRRVTFVVKRGCLTAKAAAEGWAAYRRLARSLRPRPVRLTPFGLRDAG